MRALFTFCMLLVPGYGSAQDWNPNVGGPASSYENLVATIYMVAKCENDPIDIEPFLSELESSGLTDAEKASYRTRIGQAQGNAYADRRAAAQESEISEEEFMRRDCYWLSANGLRYAHKKRSAALREERDTTIQALRDNTF